MLREILEMKYITKIIVFIKIQSFTNHHRNNRLSVKIMQLLSDFVSIVLLQYHNIFALSLLENQNIKKYVQTQYNWS